MVDLQRVVNGLADFIHLLPCLKMHISVTRRAIKRWSSHLTPKQVIPLTKAVLFAFARSLREQNNLDIVACLSTMWAGLIRYKEAVLLRIDDG